MSWLAKARYCRQSHNFWRNTEDATCSELSVASMHSLTTKYLYVFLVRLKPPSKVSIIRNIKCQNEANSKEKNLPSGTQIFFQS